MIIENILYPPIIDTSVLYFEEDLLEIHFFSGQTEIKKGDIVTVHLVEAYTGRNLDKYDININSIEESYIGQIILTDINSSLIMVSLSLKRNNVESIKSEAVLFKKISNIPTFNITLTGVENHIYNPANPLIISGELINDKSTDILKDYDITITYGSYILEKTGILYPVEKNNFIYFPKYDFDALDDKDKVIIAIEYNCVSGLGGKELYEFSIFKPKDNAELLNLINFNSYAARDENIQISFEIQCLNQISGQIKIFRSNEKNNYQLWAKVCEDTFINIKSGAVYQWTDLFVEAGRSYKYKIQFYNQDYGYAEDLTSGIINPIFEDIVLYSNALEKVRIKYNPSITNFKYITNDAVISTLGAKFPVMIRNGDVYYRQFSLGGLISYNAELMNQDQENIYDSLDQEITYSALDIEDQYNRNAIFEKRFREKVFDFLHDGKMKLFKSPTEGNMLIGLKDISFTPNPTLGRNIYSFTALATEIAEYNEENLFKYGFLGDDNNKLEEVSSL